jgi:hypothetical protein
MMDEFDASVGDQWLRPCPKLEILYFLQECVLSALEYAAHLESGGTVLRRSSDAFGLQ